MVELIVDYIRVLMFFLREANPVFVGSIVFVFGAVFGSFINVLNYRLPLEMDVVFKPSFCPKCKRNIKWYHNIPIISYLYLGGKCAYCRESIAIGYFLIELLTAFSFLAFYLLYGVTWDFIVLCLFFIISLPVLIIDFRYHIIPDELSIGGAVVGLFLGFVHTFIGFDNNTNITISMIDSIWGVVVGLLIFGGIYVSSLLVFRKEGMGLGDVKFAATIGAFLGSSPSIVAFLLSFLYGSFLGLIIMIFKRLKNMKKIKTISHLKNLNISSDYVSSIVMVYVYQNQVDELRSSYIAFGPYMVLGAWTSIFFAHEMIGFFVGEII
ncbi:MAG: prepilin peptidase [Candidatus Calescibacterium sp.]|nr:prepilin peptidase [Candidatus Calescibacterium sp.]MDW8133055.1 prepilin peptidase [Candidatus Calescibacterium sp.]